MEIASLLAIRNQEQLDKMPKQWSRELGGTKVLKNPKASSQLQEVVLDKLWPLKELLLILHRSNNCARFSNITNKKGQQIMLLKCQWVQLPKIDKRVLSTVTHK